MLLLENDTVKDLYTGHETIFPEDNYKFLNVVRALSTFNSTKPYLSRTGFISENNNRFVSSSYTSFLEDFYGNSYYGHVINQENYLRNYEKRGEAPSTSFDLEEIKRYVDEHYLDYYIQFNQKFL